MFIAPLLAGGATREDRRRGHRASRRSPAAHARAARSRPSGSRTTCCHRAASRSGEVFTGLVAGTGRGPRRWRDGARWRSRPRWPASSQPGDSIAVNGVCLTAREPDDGALRRRRDGRDAPPHARSAPLAIGDEVNLELPLRAGDRLGGHMVQGHVDGTGHGRVGDRGGHSPAWCGSRPPPELLRYVVEKGSIAVDGVSLTVSSVDDDGLRGVADPRDARAHDARRGRARPRREPGGGRAGQVRGEAERPDERTRPSARSRRRIEDVRAGQDGRGLRRRGPRERGRPHAGGPVRHARGDQLHGHARARPDLPRAHRPSAATSSAST